MCVLRHVASTGRDPDRAVPVSTVQRPVHPRVVRAVRMDDNEGEDMMTVWGKYRGKAEVLNSSATTWNEAHTSAADYRMRLGYDWGIWIGTRNDDPTLVQS